MTLGRQVASSLRPEMQVITAAVIMLWILRRNADSTVTQARMLPTYPATIDFEGCTAILRTVSQYGFRRIELP